MRDRAKGKRAAVHARMTELEFKALELMAGQEQRNVSDMVRALVREGARARSILPTVGELHKEGIVITED